MQLIIRLFLRIRAWRTAPKVHRGMFGGQVLIGTKDDFSVISVNNLNSTALQALSEQFLLTDEEAIVFNRRAYRACLPFHRRLVSGFRGFLVAFVLLSMYWLSQPAPVDAYPLAPVADADFNAMQDALRQEAIDNIGEENIASPLNVDEFGLPPVPFQD